MKKTLIYAMLLALMCWAGIARSQPVISYPAPAQALTRGLDTSLLTVDIGFMSACTGTQVQLRFPAGVTYVPGSVTATAGTPGLAISYLSGTPGQPTFSITNAALGNNITFTVKRVADCGSGSGGKDSVYVTSACGNASETGGVLNNYNILAPSLSITAPAPITGALTGNTYTRTITVTNGGNGCVDSLTFYIVRPATNITAASLKVGALTIAPHHSTGDSTYYVVAGAALPSGDNLLCNGEQVVFTESYTLTGCLGTGSFTEAYGAGWGRIHTASGLCQKATATGLVNHTSTLPVLNVSQRIINANNCADAAQITVVLKNTGIISVQNIAPYVGVNPAYNGSPYFMDTTSVTVKINNGTPYHPSGITSALTLNGSNSGTACWAGKPAAVRFPLTGIILQPGDSIVFSYTTMSCVNTPAQACGTGFGGDAPQSMAATYQDMCGVNYNTGFAPNGSVAPSNVATADITLMELPAQVFPGQCFNYKVGASRYGGTNKSYVEYILTLPPNISFSSVQPEILTGVTPMPGYPQIAGSVVTVRYPNTQSNFFVSFRLCATSSGACGSISLPVTFNYILDSSCTSRIYPSSCKSSNINIPCTGPGSCTNGGPQVAFFEAYRTNYGKPDNNRDGLPDASGSVDLTKIELTHFRPGDTLHTNMSTVVNANTVVPYNDWNFVYNEWNFGTSSYATWAPAGTATVTIRRGGAVLYTITGIIPSVITADKRFKADWSSSLPVGFKYLPGDSISISSDFRLKANLDYYSTYAVRTTPVLAGARINLSLAEGMYASQVANPVAAAQYTCSGGTFNYVVLGTQHYTDLQTNTVGCSDKAITGKMVFVPEINNGGIPFFLYENRPAFKPDSMIITIPPGYQYTGVTSQTYNGIPISITPVVTGNPTIGYKIVYDLKTAIAGGLPWNDGTDGTYNLPTLVKPLGCATPATGTATIVSTGHFIHANDGINPERYSVNYSIPIIWDNTTKPNVVLQNNTGTVQGVTAQQYWDVQLNNTNGSYGAPNVWLALEKGTGSITIDSVVLKPSNAILPATAYGPGRNWYKVSAAGINPSSNQKVRVYFKYGNCSADSIKLVSGWDCVGFPVDPNTGTCGINTTYLKVTPTQGMVQLSMENQPTTPSIAMCTTDSVTAVINSAQTANVDNPQITIIPPVGLTIVQPIQVEYPVNSGNWQAITPINNAGNLVVNIEDHTAVGSQGLAGVTLNPGLAGRQARIKLKYTASCDYVSGSRVGFITTGKDPCGAASTGSGDFISSNPINITGATTTGTAALTINVNPPILNCSSVQTVPFSVTPVLAPTGTNDIAVYTLPYGIEYAGNFTPGTNCTGCTLTQTSGTGNSTVLTVALPAGITSGTPIAFTVDLKASKVAACGNSTIIAEVHRGIAGITCGATPCPSSKVVIGSASQTVTIKKPMLNISSISFTQSSVVTVNYSATVVNDGTEASMAGNVVKIFCGTDANGTLLHSTTLGSVPVGGSAIVTGTFTRTNATCPSGSAIFARVEDTLANGALSCLCASATGTFSSQALPIKFTAANATATNCAVVVSWKYETSNTTVDKFEIERSSNGSDFTKIATTAATATTYTDEVPYPGNWFYRIGATGKDNSTAYTATLAVNVSKCGSGGIRVYPNPAKTELHIVLPSNTKATFMLHDAIGRSIATGENNDNSDIKVDVSNMPPGLYNLRVISNGIVHAQNITIAK